MRSSELSANEKVTNYILEQIRDKKMIEGSKLPTEIELSQSLSVGRNAVREALKTLQFIDLVQSTKGSGYRLTSSFDSCLRRIIQFLFEMSQYSAYDIRNIREALEIKSLQLIRHNENISASDIEVLNDCIDHMNRNDSPEEYDLLFHRTIARLSGNSLIYTTIDALSKVTEDYILIPWGDIEDADFAELVVCHKKLAACISEPCSDHEISAAVMQHYNIADKIINSKRTIDALPVNDFLAIYKTEEEMLQAIGDLWRKKNANNTGNRQ